MVSGVAWHMWRSEALLLPVSVGLAAAYTTDDGKEIDIFYFYKKKSIREALRTGTLEGCCPTFFTMLRGREGVQPHSLGGYLSAHFIFSLAVALAIGYFNKRESVNNGVWWCTGVPSMVKNPLRFRCNGVGLGT